MNYSFDQAAAADVDAIAEFYGRESQLAALRFIDDTIAAIKLLLVNPRMGTVVPNGCREFMLKRFPLSLIYQIDEVGKHILIVAISHQKRRPGHWRNRVQEGSAIYAIAA